MGNDLQRPGIVYVAGPMRGYADFNFPAFDAARDFLKSAGHTVISPADMDRDLDGGVIRPVDVYIDRDVAAIRRVTRLAVLPGWEHSTGAAAEFFLARWRGLPILNAITGSPLHPDAFMASALENAVRHYLAKGCE